MKKKIMALKRYILITFLVCLLVFFDLLYDKKNERLLFTRK